MNDYCDMSLNDSSLDSIATSVILELRRIVTDMGVDSAHEILDELEIIISRNSSLKA